MTNLCSLNRFHNVSLNFRNILFWIILYQPKETHLEKYEFLNEYKNSSDGYIHTERRLPISRQTAFEYLIHIDIQFCTLECKHITVSINNVYLVKNKNQSSCTCGKCRWKYFTAYTSTVRCIQMQTTFQDYWSGVLAYCVVQLKSVVCTLSESCPEEFPQSMERTAIRVYSCECLEKCLILAVVIVG